MSNPKATVKHTPLNVHKAADGVQKIEAMIAAGTASPDVQGSPVTKQALADVGTAVAPVAATISVKENAIATLNGARKSLTKQFTALEIVTRTYETAVNSLAAGDGAVIAKAGCLTRDQKTPKAALAEVTGVTSKLGKAAKEAVVSWPKVPGATSYALQANFTPATPAGPFTPLPSGSSYRRTITAPAPGAQFLVQIAAVASDGTQSAWCPPYLVTAK
jgi:hypothetical protein